MAKNWVVLLIFIFTSRSFDFFDHSVLQPLICRVIFYISCPIPFSPLLFSSLLVLSLLISSLLILSRILMFPSLHYPIFTFYHWYSISPYFSTFLSRTYQSLTPLNRISINVSLHLSLIWWSKVVPFTTPQGDLRVTSFTFCGTLGKWKFLEKELGDVEQQLKK